MRIMSRAIAAPAGTSSRDFRTPVRRRRANYRAGEREPRSRRATAAATLLRA